MVQARRSLKSRALQLLAQRDQSRVELRQKLLRHARQFAEDGAVASAEAQVDTLLDWLEAERFLSGERFVESRVQARLARFGNQRIRAELARHGLQPPADVARSLAESEFERASALHARRFDGPPASEAERASRSRFLVGRGFSGEVIQRLMRRLRQGA